MTAHPRRAPGYKRLDFGGAGQTGPTSRPGAGFPDADGSGPPERVMRRGHTVPLPRSSPDPRTSLGLPAQPLRQLTDLLEVGPVLERERRSEMPGVTVKRFRSKQPGCGFSAHLPLPPP